jgi:hypothetical protein
LQLPSPDRITSTQPEPPFETVHGDVAETLAIGAASAGSMIDAPPDGQGQSFCGEHVARSNVPRTRMGGSDLT